MPLRFAPPPAIHADTATARGVHIPALDGMRGLAILLVIQSHLAVYYAVRTPPGASRAWVDHGYFRITNVGWSGVDLFFVLSGFLITGILLDAKKGAHYFRSFYARRFLRIFPVYYGFLFFVIVIVPHVPPLARTADVSYLTKHQWLYWTYLDNIFLAIKQLSPAEGSFVNGHFWSLALEEQFYLAWPLVVLLLTRHQLMVLSAALVVGALALRAYVSTEAASSFASPFTAYLFTPARLDVLAAGAFLALAARSPREFTRCVRWAPYLAVGSAVTIVVLFATQDGLSLTEPPVYTLGLSAIALLFTALLALTLAAGPRSAWQRLFTHPILVVVGRYSYGMYIFHLLIIATLSQRISDRGGLPQVFGLDVFANLAVAVVTSTMTFGAAWLSWHLFEKQFLKLKRFFPYGEDPALESRPGSGHDPKTIAPAR